MFSSRLLIALATVAFLAGCSSGDRAKVTIRSSNPHQLYTQSFDQAYITSNKEGEFDIVLLQDTIDRSKPLPSTNKPLQPVHQADFRQIVHIHVFWQGQGGSIARDGMVTNSTIAWYVIGNDNAAAPEMVRYEGAGYVMLDEGKKTTAVQIRDGLLRQKEIRGGLKDPLGASTLVGNITAQRNGPVVRELLADLRAQTAAFRQPMTDIR